MARRELRIVAALLIAAFPAAAQVTERVSVDSNGQEGSGASFSASLSADGRYVVFVSSAPNLVSGDTNGKVDVFVRDRQTGITERVHVDSSGIEADADAGGTMPWISLDGRLVTFSSDATNLVPNDTNGFKDVFVRDRWSGTTSLVSAVPSGAVGNASSYNSMISADGRFVVFQSLASDLVPSDSGFTDDVFVRDLQNGTTECVSVDLSGIPGSGNCRNPWISADGRFVTFDSFSSELVPVDVNGTALDVFLRDRQSGTTELAALTSSGSQSSSQTSISSISDDGRYVAFESGGADFVPNDHNSRNDIFVRDRFAGTVVRVSVSDLGIEANRSSLVSTISGNGRFVAFQTSATNLVPADVNMADDIYVRDLHSGTIARASVSSSGVGAGGAAGSPTISFDGRVVSFPDTAVNLVPGDTNGATDVFVRDLSDVTDFVGVCLAGLGGVSPCPCFNPPAPPGRGCDNSANTGGALLTASGAARLSADTLVFTTSGERSTALSVLAQWTGTNTAGVIFGMGVRCTSGALKRLYTRSAVSGSIQVPNVGAGDLPVSARSAALGDVIQAGESRWYLVYYRDPIVLGGCPSTSTFNSTQTGHVGWAM